MELIRALENLFEHHAPETLMALFGAGTSLLLFYLIWSVLRQLFGLQNRSVDWDFDQDQATAALVEALVGALVTESGHLRVTLDGILQESLQRSERNTQSLALLLTQAEATPGQILELLQPEFAQLQQELRRAEASIVAQIHESGCGDNDSDRTELTSMVREQSHSSKDE
jgi:hypothetical protein